MVRSKPSSTGRSLARIGERDVAEADLARGQAVGPAAAPGEEPASAPCTPIAGSRRSTAATGAAAPSSAQLRPPKAMALTPTATCAKTTTRPRSRRPPAAAEASDQNTATLAARTSSRLQASGLSRRRVASVLQLVQARPPADEALHHPVDQAEEAQLLGRGRIDGEPVGVLGVALRLAHLLGVAVAPDRALAQEPVGGEPRPGQDERRPPRVAEEDGRGGEPHDRHDQPPGDEVHVDVHRRPGHARGRTRGPP